MKTLLHIVFRYSNAWIFLPLPICVCVNNKSSSEYEYGWEIFRKEANGVLEDVMNNLSKALYEPKIIFIFWVLSKNQVIFIP